MKGVRKIKTLASIPNVIIKRLLAFGFNDTIDKLIVRLAYKTNDKKVVSDDSDFWDPRRNRPVGDAGGCVANLLWRQLSIEVMLLGTLFQRV